VKVAVVWAGTHVQDLVEVELPRGATVADAVERSGLLAHHGLDATDLACSIYGRRANCDALLADGDRVELTRPLRADPKDLRRHRARSTRP
jgi:hypothetical protein